MPLISRRAVRIIMKASNAGQAHLVSLTAHICLHSVSERCFWDPSLGLDKMPDHFWQLASLLIGAELDAEEQMCFRLSLNF